MSTKISITVLLCPVFVDLYHGLMNIYLAVITNMENVIGYEIYNMCMNFTIIDNSIQNFVRQVPIYRQTPIKNEQ